MITAIDTNVLLDLLLTDAQLADAAIRTIESASQAGSVVICDLVYAEVSGHFLHKSDCDDFLEKNEIAVISLTRESCFLASRIWRQYRKQGGTRTRILPDFLIGAHAQLQATRLISRDVGFYKKLFPKLELRDPSDDLGL